MSVILGLLSPPPRPAAPWWYPPRDVDGDAWLAAMREVDAWCPSLAEAVPHTMAEAEERVRPWTPPPPNMLRGPRSEPTHPPPRAPQSPRAQRGQRYDDLVVLIEKARPAYVPSEPLEPGETHEAYLLKRPSGTVRHSR